jgi:hypothetical protein
MPGVGSTTRAPASGSILAIVLGKEADNKFKAGVVADNVALVRWVPVSIIARSGPWLGVRFRGQREKLECFVGQERIRASPRP